MSEKNHNIPEDVAREIKETLENQTLSSAVAKIKDCLQQLERVELNIAITGESGSGKSTFVNAFRGLGDEDEGSAPTGETETTMEPIMYPHPKYPRVKLWDLPGIGSPNFKAEEYLRKVKFQRYDFFIIIGSERFKSSNVYLATEIELMKKRFYFARSKMDHSIKDASRKKGFDEAKKLEEIREDCIKGFEKGGVKSPKVFLISSHNLKLYDFPKLEETMERDLPKHKQLAFLQSLPNITKEINQKKKAALEAKIWKVSLLSATVAAVPIPGLSTAVDVAILVTELKSYYRAFNLDDESLQHLSNKTNVPLKELKAACKSPLNKEISVEVVIKLLSKFAGGGLMLLDSWINIIPVLGSLAAAQISYVTTHSMLTSCLNELAEDADNVLERAFETLA